MHTCYRCAKTIKGLVFHSDPPLYLIHLGLESPKTFHPKCYDLAEKEAEKELATERKEL